MWPCTNYSPPLPPLRRKLPDRPKVNRRKDLSEKATRHTVSKVGKRILCSVCKKVGHNKVTCPNVDKPKKLKVKKKKKDNGGINGGEGGSGTKKMKAVIQVKEEVEQKPMKGVTNVKEVLENNLKEKTLQGKGSILKGL